MSFINVLCYISLPDQPVTNMLYLLIGQMVVAKVLSRLYADMLLYGQSIVYYEHCVSVSRELKDKRLEGEYLEILSSLYLSLNTERWVFFHLPQSASYGSRPKRFQFWVVWCRSSRKSLDYTKQSLRISIDLGKREEESETWLQVGRIYYLIHEDELADMYLQVRGTSEGVGNALTASCFSFPGSALCYSGYSTGNKTDNHCMQNCNAWFCIWFHICFIYYDRLHPNSFLMMDRQPQ